MEAQLIHERIRDIACITSLFILLITGIIIYFKRRLKQEHLLYQKAKRFQTLLEKELIALRNKETDYKKYLFLQTGLTERINVTQIDIRKKDHPVSPFTHKDFPVLFQTLDIIYNNFATRLKVEFPDLKERDIEICCLLKAGAKTKNISFLIAMTPNAVSKKKNQIAEKMDLPPHSESLYDFLIRF